MDELREEYARKGYVDVRILDFMPYDHYFNGELCHATGLEVENEDGDSWYEYEDSDGNLHYGR